MAGRTVAPLVLLLWAASATAAAQAPADDLRDGSLILADWRGAFLGRGVDGSLALLAGPDGSCRAEVTRGAAPPAALLDRDTEGWTVVLAGSGDGVLQPWGREWSRLDATATAGLRTIADAVAAAAVGEDVGRRGGMERVVLPPARAEGFRAANASRGRGRGGPGEVLVLVRGRGGDALAVRSSRRPGALRFSSFRCLPVRYPPAEVFVPLWPLRGLLELESEIPGTCRPAGG